MFFSTSFVKKSLLLANINIQEILKFHVQKKKLSKIQFAASGGLVISTSTMEDIIPQFEVLFITSVDKQIAVLQTAMCIVLLPISLTLIFGIVNYEHFGVDSQKRSFYNQTISAWFISLGLNEILVMVSITIRCWTGPFGHVGGMIVSVARRFFLIVASFWTIEFLLYKNMSILFPHYTIRLRDNFWTIFCCGWNTIFGVLFTNIEWFLQETHPPIYLFMSGEDEMLMSHKQMFIFLIVWVIVAILAVSFMIIRLFKNPSPDPVQTQQGFGFNNMKHNPAIVNNLQMVFVVMILLAVCYPSIFVTTIGPNAFVLKTIPMSIAAYLVVPSCFYAFNKKLRKYVWRETKEALGLDFQTIEPIENARF